MRHITFPGKKPELIFALALGAFASAFVSNTAAQQTQTPVPETHPALTVEKISLLAHRLEEEGVKTNALSGDDLKPWHMKMDFQVIPFGEKKPVNGTMEEWYLGPDHWARTFKSSERNLTGTEWSVSKTEQFQSKPAKVGFEHRLLVLRVARPVIDPLYQAANLQPDYEMDVKRANTAGLALNCVSVVNPQRYVDQANPDWLFPTMCFDNDRHLRLTATSDTSVQFADLQPFEGRTVARDVQVLFNGALIAEMKVTLVEPLANANPDLVKPAPDAIPLPYTIEPGHQKPVSIYEVAASVPLQPSGFPFRGTFLIPVTIHKDGSVKAHSEGATAWNQELRDALAAAVNKWKFKPYLVDGQPVEVAWTVAYILDGKPFIPSYQRTTPQIAPPQQDGPGDAGTPAPRRRWH